MISTYNHSMLTELSHYPSRAVRALVLLHEQHMHAFIEVWKQAKQAKLALPVTGEEKYGSLDYLLQHVFGSSRKYVIRMCGHLGRPEPDFRPVPQVHDIAAEVDSYGAYLLDRWRTILADVRDRDLEPKVYTLGMHYWIDAMLEHAVMHPIRHEFQLEELLEQQRSA